MIMSCAAADVIEICDDEGELCRVYDAETLTSIEKYSFTKFEKNKYDTKVFAPAEIYLRDSVDTFCINQDRMYFTYYSSVNGVGAHPEFTYEEGQFWDACDEYYEDNTMTCHTTTLYGCSIRLVMKDKYGADVKSNYISLCTSGGFAYHFTTKENSYLFSDSKFSPGDMTIRVYGECYDNSGNKYYSEWVDKYDVTLSDCRVSCQADYYKCVKGKSYKVIFDASDNCAQSTVADTDTNRNLLCEMSYCSDLGKYWYDNACHSEKQCTSLWSCGDWGPCDANTKLQMQQCSDGCGDTKSETQSCSVDDPDISICGNDVCERGEYEYNCPEDCTGTDPVRECGDKVCDPEIGEDYINCPDDCIEPYRCGDNVCDNEETIETCPEDCRFEEYCGDGYCNKMTESCDDCPTDCDICALCLNDNDCVPEKADECIEYTCYEGSCKEVYLMTEKCMPSQWALIWADYKNLIIGGSVLLTLMTVAIVVLIILWIMYIVVKKKK